MLVEALDRIVSPRTLNRLGYLVGALGCLVTALALWSPVHLVVQGFSEQSVPFRMGLRVDAPTTWAHGQLVQFRTRDLRPYYPAGLLFTKLVGAVPGDRLTVEGHRFRVNGVDVGSARATDSLGRPAPLYLPAPDADGACRPTSGDPAVTRMPSSCTIPPGFLWVLGTHERSFDSRYYGLIRPEEVVGRVIPVF